MARRKMVAAFGESLVPSDTPLMITDRVF